jgi:hypothetical protein
VLTGDARVDVGKMVVVVPQTKCDEATGATKEKLKHPESLIQLEEGLRLEQDFDGMLWIVRGENEVE